MLVLCLRGVGSLVSRFYGGSTGVADHSADLRSRLREVSVIRIGKMMKDIELLCSHFQGRSELPINETSQLISRFTTWRGA
jgi:hypothetical protein